MATNVFHLSSEAFGVVRALMARPQCRGAITSHRAGRAPKASEFLEWAIVFGAAECAAAVIPAAWACEAIMILIGGTVTLYAITATLFIR